VLAYPDVQILDVTCPLDVFARAARLLHDRGAGGAGGDDAYTVEILGLSRGPIVTSSGLRLHADRAFEEVGGGIDTLLVAGGVGSERYAWRPDVISWVRQQARQVRRLASVCTGAFLLARAGLPRGRSIYSAADVTAGIDLALALVEADHGLDVALGVARALVVLMRGPGGQARLSALSQQFAERDTLRELQAYIADHPQADLSVDVLARRVGMSPRNFARVFAREVGTTPARFVAAVRVEIARRLLEGSADDIEAICARSGLGSTESMRRTFIRRVGVPPSVYRARFRVLRQPIATKKRPRGVAW